MEALNLERKGLYKLKDLKNYKIVKPDSDVRGWDVFSNDKKNIGIIDEIIVDPKLKKVCYLDIYLHSDIKTKNGNRHLFVPVNTIKFDLIKESVYLTNIKTVISLRKIEPGNEQTGEESGKNHEMMNNNDLSQSSEDSFYNNKLFDESNFHRSKEKKLCRLRELDNPRIFENFPDVRGWHVITSDNINIGQVDDLFIDKEINKLRYLDIKIYEGPIFDVERHILVPVGLAELDEDNNKILIKIDSNDFVNYPPYNGEEISDYENSLFNSFKNDDDPANIEKPLVNKQANHTIDKFSLNRKIKDYHGL